MLKCQVLKHGTVYIVWQECSELTYCAFGDLLSNCPAVGDMLTEYLQTNSSLGYRAILQAIGWKLQQAMELMSEPGAAPRYP